MSRSIKREIANNTPAGEFYKWQKDFLKMYDAVRTREIEHYYDYIDESIDANTALKCWYMKQIADTVKELADAIKAERQEQRNV